MYKKLIFTELSVRESDSQYAGFFQWTKMSLVSMIYVYNTIRLANLSLKGVYSKIP